MIAFIGNNNSDTRACVRKSRLHTPAVARPIRGVYISSLARSISFPLPCPFTYLHVRVVVLPIPYVDYRFRG